MAGVPIAKVSKWLGHSSITMTVDTYGHVLPDPDEHEVVDRLDSIGRLEADAATIRNKSATPSV